MKNDILNSTGVLSLLIWIFACLGAGALGAIATMDAPTFYISLIRPGWAPAPNVFGPVWTTLYCLIGVAGWLAWTREPTVSTPFFRAFVAQLGLNALWSWLFFRWHMGLAALFDLAAILILAVVASFHMYRSRKLAGLLMAPYLLWLSFALALNYHILAANPARL